jgi:hypothetical protein
MTDPEIIELSRRIFEITGPDPRVEHFRRGITSVRGGFGQDSITPIQKYIELENDKITLSIWIGYNKKYNIVCVADITPDSMIVQR